MTTRYFRADKAELLSAGEPLVQSDHYPDRCNPTVKLAEQFLRIFHKLGTARATSIFIFEDERETRNYYARDKGRNLYELAVEADDIVHRADLEWIDMIGKAIAAGDATTAKEYADNWIAGVPSSSPRWETLAKAAKVKTVLGTAADSPANKTAYEKAVEKQKHAPLSEYPFLSNE